jgi:hypothetical protein
MSMNYNAFNHKAWAEAGLKDFGDFAECVEYVNQFELGDGTLEGEWYYCDDETRTIYTGTFGNYNSPGASSYTNADVYDEDEIEEYNAEKAKLEAQEEYDPESPDYSDDGDDEEEDEDDGTCAYCGGNCPNEPDDSPNLCDGFAGDVDNLYGTHEDEKPTDGGDTD